MVSFCLWECEVPSFAFRWSLVGEPGHVHVRRFRKSAPVSSGFKD